MLKIEDLEITDECEIQVNDANGNPIEGFHIGVLGPGNMARRAAEFRWRERKAKLSPGDEEGHIASNAEFLSDCTSYMHGLDEQDSGHSLYMRVYSNPRLGYVVNQMFSVMNDWGKFAKKPAKKPGFTHLN